MANTSDLITNANAGSDDSNFAWVPIPLPRDPKLSHDEFLEYWKSEHASKAVPIMEAYDIDAYIQVHVPDLSSASQEALGAADETEAAELRKIDGVAFIRFPLQTLVKMPEVLQHPYGVQVLVPDERFFVQEEFGLKPLAVRDPPYMKAPAWSPEQWREWGKKVGGTEYHVIDDGKTVAPVAEKWRKKWEELNSNI